MPTLQQFIAISFENQLLNFQKSGINLKKGDYILAKMRGYNPWPARIIDFSGNNKNINCYFYGTNNIGLVGIKHAIPFADSFETVRLICLRNLNGFVKGVKEIETKFGIPNHLSCLREYEAIA